MAFIESRRMNNTCGCRNIQRWIEKNLSAIFLNERLNLVEYLSAGKVFSSYILWVKNVLERYMVTCWSTCIKYTIDKLLYMFYFKCILDIFYWPGKFFYRQWLIIIHKTLVTKKDKFIFSFLTGILPKKFSKEKCCLILHYKIVIRNKNND